MIYEGTNEVLRTYIGLAGLQTPAGGEKRGVTMAHPALAREARVIDGFTAELRARIDEAVRLHGREVSEKQHVLARVARMAMDLYAIAACVSRSSRAIDKRGEAGAGREIDLSRAFVAGAERRLGEAVRSFDDNDDDLVDQAAGRAYADGGYPLDALLEL